MKFKIGDEKNNRVILEITSGAAGKHRLFKCKCLLCNKITLVPSNNFKVGKGCECKKYLYNDLSGKTIGKVNVVSLLKRNCETGKSRGHLYLCQCIYCGKKHEFTTCAIQRVGFTGCRCNTKDINHAAKKKVYQAYKTNAKKRNLPFELTYEQVINLCLKNCTYCGNEPISISKAVDIIGIFKYNGIDRKDNNLGYTENNSISCCKICNWMKQKLSYDDFIAHIKQINNHLNQ
jgi:hypothetical protein